MVKEILNLYPEDFEYYSTWRDICDILGLDSSTAQSACIEFVRAGETEDELQDLPIITE